MAIGLKRERGRILKSRGFAWLIRLVILALNGYLWMRSRQAILSAWGVEAGPLLAFVLLGMLAVHQAGARMKRFGPIRHLMVVGGGVYLSFLMYFVLILIALDLAALVTPLNLTASYFTALALALGVSLYGLLNAGRVARVDYRIDLGLGRPYRVALLSDIHMGDFVGPRHLKKVARCVGALDADLVLIAGDLFNGHGLEDVADAPAALQALAALHARDGVYAVYGNHDPLPDDPQPAAFLRQAGIHLLRDKGVRVGPIYLVGRNDYSRPDLRAPLSALAGPGAHALVVLDHNPWGIDEAARAGAALVLCGHTHRGQLAPMSLLTRRAVGKDYFYGLTRHGGTTTVITSGAGYFGLPMRVGTRCEAVCLTLT